MRKQKVISKKVRITSKAGVVYFDIRLPDDAVKIIGVESGIRMISNVATLPVNKTFLSTFSILPNNPTGYLRLQHPGCSSWFYSTQIKEPYSMLGYADFSTWNKSSPSSHTHGFSRWEDAVQIPKQAKLISAVYTDLLKNKTYDLLLHIWVETKKADDK